MLLSVIVGSEQRRACYCRFRAEASSLSLVQNRDEEDLTIFQDEFGEIGLDLPLVHNFSAYLYPRMLSQ